MSVSEVDQSKLEVLRQHITELEAKNVKTKAEKADIEDMYIELLEAIREEYTRRDAEKAEFKARIEELEKNRTDAVAENAELRARVVKLEQDIDELKKELESKKKRKFQEKCILIAQVLLGEEPIVEYRPSFMRGLELDAFFRDYRMALEVQGAQHLNIGFIILAGIKMSKNSRILSTVIEKKEPYVSLMEFIFLKYGMTRIRKLRFLRRYINLKSVLIEKTLILINLYMAYTTA